MNAPSCFGEHSTANVTCALCESAAACKLRTAQIAAEAEAEPETFTDGDD